ncbi:Hypothetical predicted protein [Cloeon dipterum]|uniref:Sialin n=1 Tax=Cloeon dipterum TaxID=197152 RepID=A0A8S1E648_9INSE|nr:Hypothetical predicted protein [Cloeon dipterum]
MQISETTSSERPTSKSGCCSMPRRYLVAFLAFLGFWNVYALRVNLSVAIVAMTSNYTVTLDNGTVIQKRDFDWDSKTRGLLLSSFFYGYIITQIPGGWLGARVGGALLFGAGIASTALLTLLTPLAATGGVTFLFVLRVLEGVFEGVTYPCIHAVWARWAPPMERSKLATLAFSGSYVGTVVALPLSGYLAKHVGWPYVFYVFGFIGLVWYAVWVAVVREGPELDPRISQEELEYIQKSLGQQPQKTSPPWGQFFKSAPVWAIITAHFAENWGFYTLLTQLPTFMKDTLEFDLKDAGLLSALPYLAMAAVLQMAGHLADWLRSKEFISTTGVRKLFNCGAFISQTTFMMLAAYLLTPLASVACLTVAVGLGGFAWSGFSVNHLDIAPQYASVLMGLSNTFATLPGIISPALTGIIVYSKSVEEWKIVFYIASAIYLFGAVIYAICASGERQPWAILDEPSPAEVKKNEHDRYNGLYDFNSTEQLKLPRPKLPQCKGKEVSYDRSATCLNLGSADSEGLKSELKKSSYKSSSECVSASFQSSPVFFFRVLTRLTVEWTQLLNLRFADKYPLRRIKSNDGSPGNLVIRYHTYEWAHVRCSNINCIYRPFSVKNPLDLTAFFNQPDPKNAQETQDHNERIHLFLKWMDEERSLVNHEDFAEAVAADSLNESNEKELSNQELLKAVLAHTKNSYLNIGEPEQASSQQRYFFQQSCKYQVDEESSSGSDYSFEETPKKRRRRRKKYECVKPAPITTPSGKKRGRPKGYSPKKARLQAEIRAKLFGESPVAAALTEPRLEIVDQSPAAVAYEVIDLNDKAAVSNGVKYYSAKPYSRNPNKFSLKTAARNLFGSSSKMYNQARLHFIKALILAGRIPERKPTVKEGKSETTNSPHVAKVPQKAGIQGKSKAHKKEEGQRNGEEKQSALETKMGKKTMSKNKKTKQKPKNKDDGCSQPSSVEEVITPANKQHSLLKRIAEDSSMHTNQILEPNHESASPSGRVLRPRSRQQPADE